MKTKLLLGIALMLLATGSAPLRAQNIVSNGSFEFPAFPGDGDAYPVNGAAFVIPGWEGYFTSIDLFIEHGTPAGLTRYADGRQALCLNNNGLGAEISQVIPTVPGRNYRLSFAQADKSMGAATASQVSVQLRCSRMTTAVRTFSRANDPSGYTVKNWHFTAPACESVTIFFADSTPSGLSALSPFLDSVSIVPASLLLAGFHMNVPSWFGPFDRLPRGPGVWGGSSNLVFFGASGGQEGIYGFNNYPSDPQLPIDPYKIADLNTPIPGGSGNFISFTGGLTGPGGWPPDPCISGRNVVFWGRGENNQQGIYAAMGTSLLKIADFNTRVPGGDFGNFAAFTQNSDFPAQPSISGNRVAFFGESFDVRGIYTATLDGGLTRIADTTTPTPSAAVAGDHFIAFNIVIPPDPCISGNNVVFIAYSGNGMDSITAGVYLSADGVLSRVADDNMAAPRGGANFSSGFETSDTSPGGPQVSWGNVLFWDRTTDGGQGLFVKQPQDPFFPLDPMKVVADTQTAIPGGSGSFTGFSAMSLSWDVVAFVGLGADGQMGIYVSTPVDPIGGVPVDPMGGRSKVIDLNDMLDGKTITGLNLSRTGLDRDHNLLAFGATFDDGTQGLYTLNVFTGLRITSVARAGADLQLNFTSQVGHNYAVQSFTALVNGLVRDLISGIPGTGDIVQTIVPNAFTQPQQFYRIRQE